MASTGLESFTEDELLAEIVRRRNQPRESQDGPWCDDCAHFKTWQKRGDAPASYNPCAKKHQMQFWTPQPWESPETYGFYRSVCGDRKSVPEATRNAAAPLVPMPPLKR